MALHSDASTRYMPKSVAVDLMVALWNVGNKLDPIEWDHLRRDMIESRSESAYSWRLSIGECWIPRNSIKRKQSRLKRP